MSQPKILVYDIETAPAIGYTWTKWDTNVLRFLRDWYVMCFAWKWLGEKQTHFVSQPQFASHYKKSPHDDRPVVMELWRLFDEADVVIAHNGNSFDQKKARARFAVHGCNPPSPFLEIDTKLVARNRFNFMSNSLDDLGQFLSLGRKESTGGFELWEKCMAGDPAAWRRMERYNRQDVRLLEEVYLALRPWATTFPNMALIGGDPDVCTKCGKNDGFVKNGWKYSAVSKRQAYRCKACGGATYGRVIQTDKSLQHVN